MQYLVLIYSDPAKRPQYGTPAFQSMLDGYTALTSELKMRGAFVTGDALKGVETATSVRVRGGKTETMDGRSCCAGPGRRRLRLQRSTPRFGWRRIPRMPTS